MTQASEPMLPPTGEAPVRSYLGGFILLGLCVSVVGPSLSHLRDRVGTTDGGISWVLVVQGLGYITGSFAGGKLVDRGIGHRSWACSMALMCASLALIGFSTSLVPMCIGFVLLGSVSGIGDACGNTLVVWSRPEGPGPLLNGLHLCFAVGALTAPILANRSLAWFDSIAPISVVAGCIATWAAVTMLRAPTPHRTRFVESGAVIGTGRPASRVALVAICSFFFMYVGLEAGFAAWIHTYVEEVDPLNSAAATGVTVCFWLGFTTGRVIAIVASKRMSIGNVLAGSLTLTLVSAATFLLVARDGASLWIVTFLFALAVGPQYASMVAYAETHLTLSGSSTAAFIATSGAGGLILPWSIGQAFDRYGVTSLPVIVAIASVLTVITVLWVRVVISRLRDAVTTTVSSPAIPL